MRDALSYYMRKLRYDVTEGERAIAEPNARVNSPGVSKKRRLAKKQGPEANDASLG